MAGRTSRVSRRQQRASLSGRLREINFEFCPLCLLSLRYGLCHRAWLPPLVRRPQVSIFTYYLHFFDFVPSSRSISSTPRRVERPQTQVLPSQPFRRVKRTTPSAPHCLAPFLYRTIVSRGLRM